ncbi:RNA binding protein [Gordonia phage Lton]|nr:RNA binding protein [Gordonia phage Lton]
MDILGYVVQQRVVINLKSGTAVIGVVTEKKRTFCVVRDAAVVAPGAPGPTPADGEIVVDRGEIDYIQIAERR